MLEHGALLAEAKKEIESLHEFFVGWFSGQLDKRVFDDDFTPRFCDDLAFIPPSGQLLGLSELSRMIYGGHGSNADFRIQIRNVRLHRTIDDCLLVTYEEWQRNALASTPADNGRLASVVFRMNAKLPGSQKLQWLHIHETWLPSDRINSDPFAF